jgi:choline dehydrogenase-like flavoprotein
MPDVVVVGAGGGGPVVAKALAERGISVAMLEAGGWQQPGDYTRLEDDMGSLFDGRNRWGPSDRAKGPWMRRRDGAGLILQVAGVGGTTLHYNGICPRAYPLSFETGEWPFAYEEMIPYYEEVEEFLPVALVADLATKDALFAQGCEGIGLARSEAREITEQVWRPCHNAILPIADMKPGVELRWPDVDGCTMCGHCLQGCPHPAGAPLDRVAKRATNVSYVPAAVATGRCEVIPDAFATSILHEPLSDGRLRARGVRYRNTATGEVHEIDARVVVLACGAIESPRLWMNSGLPRTGAVGRYLTTHLQDFVTGFFDRETHPDVGQVTMARADFPGYGTIFSQGFGPQSYSAVIAAGGTGFWDDPTDGEPWDIRGKSFGIQAQRLLREYHRSLTITICSDDEADASNGITPADDWPADEHGPVPKVTYYGTKTSEARKDWLCRRAAEILRAAGAREVHRSFMLPFFTHIMSTMRIGADPGTSVCDAGGEAHAVEGLFVGDSSALPNGLGGPNPTLTVQALAQRTAGEIARRVFAQ